MAEIDVVVFLEVNLTVSSVIITLLAGLSCLEPVLNQMYLFLGFQQNVGPKDFAVPNFGPV